MLAKNSTIIEKRFRETEESVRTIANFVKRQTESNTRLLEQMKETLKPQKIDTSKYDIKIQMLEKDIRDMKEARISSKGGVPADIDKIRTNINFLNDKIKEIYSRMPEFARRDEIRNIGRGAGIDEQKLEEINEGLREQGRRVLSEFESRIRALKTEFDRDIELRMEKSLGDEAKIIRNEFDRKINELRIEAGKSKDYEHFYDDLRKTNSKLYDIETRLKSVATKDEINQKLSFIEKSEKEKSLQELKEMENMIDRMKSELNVFATKKDLESLKKVFIEENKNQKIFGALEDLRNRDEEQSAIHMSIDKRIQDLERGIQSLKMAESVEEKSDLKELEDRILGLRNLIRDVTERNNATLKETIDIQEKLKSRISTLVTHDEIEMMKDSENKLKNKLFVEFATKHDIEDLRKSMQERDISNRLMKDIALLKDVNDENITIQKSFEKRIQDIEKELRATFVAEDAEEKADIRTVLTRLSQLSKLIDDERAKRATIAKNIQELETEINTLRKERTKSLISHEVEEHMNKVITKHLGEFAKVMDKKLPNIVTREEYLSFIRDADKRLRNIESPDMSHIMQRIEMLEKEISSINTMARDVYNRIPVVVE